MMEEGSQQIVPEEPVFDAEDFIRKLAPEGDADAPAAPETAPEDFEVVPLNGSEYRVPKPVASVINQGRRFQSEKDKLEAHNRELLAELAAFRQSQSASGPKEQSAPEGPVSVFETPEVKDLLALAEKQDAEYNSDGTSARLIKSVFSVFDSMAKQNLKAQQEMRDLILRQQEQLSEVSTITAQQQIAVDCNEAVLWKAQDSGVDLSGQQREALVGELYSILRANPNLDAAGKRLALELVWTRNKQAMDTQQQSAVPPNAMGQDGRRPPVGFAIPVSRGAQSGRVPVRSRVADGSYFSSH